MSTFRLDLLPGRSREKKNAQRVRVYNQAKKETNNDGTISACFLAESLVSGSPDAYFLQSRRSDSSSPSG